MGSRKISLEPAASCLGLRGLMAMNVSLCGPHSLETSTLVLVVAEAGTVTSGSGALLSRNWYLSHQVGSFATGAASALPDTIKAKSSDSFGIWIPPFGGRDIHPVARFYQVLHKRRRGPAHRAPPAPRHRHQPALAQSSS